jgi:hypothetical protein
MTLNASRVIRTDFYFAEDVQQPPIGDLSFAWISDFGSFRTLGIQQIDEASSPIVKLDTLLNLAPLPYESDIRTIDTIRQRLYEREREYSEISQWLRRNVRADTFDDEVNRHFSRAASVVFEQDIVIERSPPTLETVGHLMTAASSTSIGILLGAHYQDPLMWLSIAGGTLLMGGVIGISRGLERGLSRRIETAIAPPIKPIRKPRSKPTKKAE